MRQKVKRVEKLVKILKDPQPRFVSFVDYGANQTPFSSMKRVGKVTPLKASKAQSDTKGERAMTLRTRKERLSRKAAKPSAIRKLIFAKKQFKDKAAVKKWLEENEYEATYKITEDGDVFEASEPKIKDSDFETLRTTTTTTKGVHGVIGTLKADTASDEEDDEDEEDEDEQEDAKARKSKSKRKASKSDSEEEDDEDESDDEEDEDEQESRKGMRRRLSQKARGPNKKKSPSKDKRQEKKKSVIAQKFDSWAAYISDGATVEDIIKDGMRDGTPPGFNEIVFATTLAMANLLKAEKGDGLKGKLASVGGEMAELVFNVHQVFAKLEDSDDEDAEKAAKSYFEEIEKVLLTPNEDEDEDEEDDDENEDGAEKDKKGSQTFASEDALGELLKLVKSTAKKVDGLSKSVSDVRKAAEEADEKAEEAKKRAEELGKRAPTKKSAPVDASDEDDDEEDEEETSKILAFERKMARSAFGV